jgi:hypothetical protein
MNHETKVHEVTAIMLFALMLLSAPYIKQVKAEINNYYISSGTSAYLSSDGSVDPGGPSPTDPTNIGNIVTLSAPTSVSLATNTKPSTNVNDGASNIELASFTFSNNSNNDVKINGISVTRIGISTDASIGSIAMYLNGTQVDSSVSFSANSATFPARYIILPGNSTLTIVIKGSLTTGNAGKTVGVKLSGYKVVDMVTGEAFTETVSVSGNLMSVVTTQSSDPIVRVFLSSSTRNSFSPLSENQKNQNLATFHITNNGANDILVNQISLSRIAISAESTLLDVSIKTSNGIYSKEFTSTGGSVRTLSNLNLNIEKYGSEEIIILGSIADKAAGQTIGISLKGIGFTDLATGNSFYKDYNVLGSVIPIIKNDSQTTSDKTFDLQSKFKTTEYKTYDSSNTQNSNSKYFTRRLSIGKRGDDVMLLQEILADKGFLKTTPTGYFGVSTYRATQAFQRANNLSPVGSTGPSTRAVLNAIVTEMDSGDNETE